MNERDWVPCHRRLLKGAKKGWPRAVRFILLELCHEARVTGGALEFPPEWDSLTAIHDRIGGDRKEIRKALVLLQIPDATGTQVIQIERDATKHRLKIIKWESWVGPKSGAERVEDHRKREVEKSNALRAPRSVTPTVKDSTVKERRGSDARAEGEPSEEPGVSERRLRISSVPPPPESEPSEAAAASTPDQPKAVPGGLRASGLTVPPFTAAASGGSERPVELVDRVWRELWQAKYRRPYESSGGRLQGQSSEDQVQVRIAELASIRVGREEAYLRHKFAAYLRDKGDREYLVNRCHPFRLIERDWAAYGEPKEPARMVPRREAAPVELVSVEEMAARAFAVGTMTAKVGNGGT